MKAALLLDSRSFSRRVLLPLLRPLARTFLVLVGLFRTLVPRGLTSSRLLHWLIYLGLRTFVSPQANFLILRHFHLGSNVVAFLAANSGTRVETHPLRPLEPGRRQGRPVPEARSQPLQLHHQPEHRARRRGPPPVAARAGRLRRDRRAPDPVCADFRAGRSTSWTRSPPSSSTRRCITCCSGSATSGARTSPCSSTRPSASTPPRSWAIPRTSRWSTTATPGFLCRRCGPGFRLVLHGLATEMLHAMLVQHKRAAPAGQPGGDVRVRPARVLWRGARATCDPCPGRRSRRASAARRLVFAITVAGFLLIYFGVGAPDPAAGDTRASRRWASGRRIADRELAPGQLAPRGPRSRWSRSPSSAATAC